MINKYHHPPLLITKLLEILNFNKKHPENHSIYVSNKRTKDIQIVEKNVCTLKDSDYTERIIFDLLEFLEEEFDKYEE